MTRLQAVIKAKIEHKALMCFISDNDRSAKADARRYNKRYWLRVASHLKYWEV